MGQVSALPVREFLPPRYRVESVLSEGDGSATFRVFDTGLRQANAVLKVQRLDDDASSREAQERFHKYCQALAGTKHPNIAAPYTFGVFRSAGGDTFGYTTREFIGGSTLTELSAPLDQKALLRVAVQVCRGLDALHSRGLRHYDLKQENVVVRRATGGTLDGLSQCVLIDLPYRQELHGDNALSDVTLQYVAPELLDARRTDARSDLYALGVLLYRLATGSLPFVGTSLPEIMQSQRSRDFTPIAEQAASLDLQFARTLERLLEPNPDNRPGSAQAVIALLEGLESDLVLAEHFDTDSALGFVGREDELAECVEALDLGSLRGASSLEIEGTNGSGVTTFLRELQDRLESRGVAVLTMQPEAISGVPMQEQLRGPVHSLTRQCANPDHVARRSAKSMTDLLDDLFVAAQDRRLVCFVDDCDQCDVSEESFLSRVIRQDAETVEGTNNRRGRCQLVLGASRDSRQGHGELRDLVSSRLVLKALSRDDIARILSYGSCGERLSKVDVERVTEVAGGHPGRVVSIVRRIALQLRSGIAPANAVTLSLEDLNATSAGESRHNDEVEAIRRDRNWKALLALALWREAITLTQWKKLVECFSRGDAGADAQSQHLSVRGGAVRVTASHLGAHLWKALPESEATELVQAVLHVVSDEWRSRDTEALFPLLRFVGRLGTVPRSCHWKVCRALILLLEHGCLAEIESFGAALAKGTGSRPWWVEAFRDAARVESGRIDSGYIREGASVDATTSREFYTTWIHARALRHARYKHEAYRHLKVLASSKVPAAARASRSLLEDYGVLAAELGFLEESLRVRARLLRRIAPWLSIVRGRRRRSSAKKGARRAQGSRKVASYYRVRNRVHCAQSRYARAMVTMRKERALNRTVGNLARESVCLNDEGVALVRSGHSDRAIGVFERCAGLREVLDDERGLVIALNNLSGALAHLGKFGNAAAILNRARVIATRNGLRRHRNLSMLNLGLAYVKRGQLRDARKVFLRVMKSGADDGDIDICARAMFNCAKVAICRWHQRPAQVYADRLRRLLSANPGHTAGLSADALMGEVAVLNRDDEALDVVIGRMRESARAADAESFDLFRLNANGEVSRPGREVLQRISYETRLRHLIWRWRRTGRRIASTSLKRLIRIGRAKGSSRECLEGALAHFESDATTQESLDLGFEILSWFELREGHDDLQIELRVRLALALRAIGRHQEAWRVVEDALARFRALERKLSRCSGHARVLASLYELLRNALRGGIRTASYPLTQSLYADAFEARVRSSGDSALQDSRARLLRLGETIARGTDRGAVLSELLSLSIADTGAQRALLVSGTAEDRHISAASVQSGQDTDADDISWAVVAQVLESGQPCIYSDALSDEELASHRSIAVLNLRSLACVPVRLGASTLGVLYLDHHGIAGLFDAQHLGFLELIAGLIATTLEVQQVERAAQESQDELRETHHHLMRAERNRVAGELASGLAHDLKNVLAAVVARSQLLRLSASDPKAKKQMQAIERAAKSGAGLIERLQECAREHGAQAAERVDLHRLAQEALELIRPRLIRGAEINRTSIRAQVLGELGVWMVGIPGELRELLLNLIINACDAMPDGGDLTISVASDERSQEAVIAVADTGAGMPEDVQKRVFEPFFTTKGKQGTGLGLVVVKNTVVRCGGSISLESASDRGTTFVVRLPVGRELRQRLSPEETKATRP